MPRMNLNPRLLILPLCLWPSVPQAAFWDGKKEPALRITLPQDAPAELAGQLEDIRRLLEDAPAGPADDPAYDRYRHDRNRAYLEKSLAAQGYYQAVVQDGGVDGAGLRHVHILPGPRYHFGTVSLRGRERVADTRPGLTFPGLTFPGPTLLETRPGAPAVAATVLADEAALSRWMSAHHCLFSVEVAHEAVLDTRTKELAVAFTVRPGREARFGPLRFAGQERVAEDYLARIVPVKEGECFRRDTVNAARVALQQTGLLATVEPEIAPAPLADGSVPVTFRLRERAPRTVKAGVSYSTDIGPGVTAGWEHRNLLSRAERLNVGLSLTPVQRLLDTGFDKPFFLRRDQTLRLGAKLEQQDTDAYTATGLALSGGLERDFGAGLLAGLGAKYGFTRVGDRNAKQEVALLSAPFFISLDRRDDVLDATSGWLLRLDSTPFVDTLGAGGPFYRNRLGGSAYHRLAGAASPVLAVRAALGSIAGASTQSVPALERYYAGGAASVRGYGYQLLGPLDAGNDPLGGRSLAEISAELRLRLRESYGVVTFLDGGGAYDDALPDIRRGLRFGAGLGLRYYTGFGPVRADIAVPLDRRRGVDAPYQLYFSIGQAF